MQRRTGPKSATIIDDVHHKLELGAVTAGRVPFAALEQAGDALALGVKEGHLAEGDVEIEIRDGQVHVRMPTAPSSGRRCIEF